MSLRIVRAIITVRDGPRYALVVAVWDSPDDDVARTFGVLFAKPVDYPYDSTAEDELVDAWWTPYTSSVEKLLNALGSEELRMDWDRLQFPTAITPGLDLPPLAFWIWENATPITTSAGGERAAVWHPILNEPALRVQPPSASVIKFAFQYVNKMLARWYPSTKQQAAEA